MMSCIALSRGGLSQYLALRFASSPAQLLLGVTLRVTVGGLVVYRG